MTFLESLCVGEAHEVITGLSCLENHAEAYTLSWQRLEKRFGNPKRICLMVHQLRIGMPKDCVLYAIKCISVNQVSKDGARKLFLTMMIFAETFLSSSL